MKKGLLLALLLLPNIGWAATTHHYTCADIPQVAGSSGCSGDVWSFSGTSDAYLDYVPNYDMGTTNWYLTLNMTGTGSSVVVQGSSFGSPAVVHASSNLSDQPFDMSAAVGANGIYLDARGTGWTGTISDLCITDTPGDCAPPPPPPSFGGGDWVLPSFATIIASTSESANLVLPSFMQMFYIILGILLGGLFALFIRRMFWKHGNKVWGR